MIDNNTPTRKLILKHWKSGAKPNADLSCHAAISMSKKYQFHKYTGFFSKCPQTLSWAILKHFN